MQAFLQAGFIGLGNMGSLMSRNLIKHSGIPLIVYDLNAEAVSLCVKDGAQAAKNVTELAKACDIIFVSLPTPAVVETVLLGDQGVLHAAKAHTMVVDLSTNSSALTIRVRDALQERGIGYLEVPVTGGVTRAADGTLTLMAGGTAEALERCQPLLKCIGNQVVHVGDVGAASTAKLINNFLLVSNLIAASEGAIMAEKAGLDIQKFVEVISTGSGGSAAFQLLTNRAFKGKFNPNFSLDLAHKDFSLAMDMASGMDVPTVMGGAAMSLLKMGRSQGLGSLDMTAVLKVYESVTGVEVRL